MYTEEKNNYKPNGIRQFKFSTIVAMSCDMKFLKVLANTEIKVNCRISVYSESSGVV